MEEQEQLMCPVCTEYFSFPVTIPCGHTFCKSCLRKSVKQKPVCPVCRTVFLSSVQTMKQNITISNIVKKTKHHSEKARKQSREDPQAERKEELIGSNTVTKKRVINKLLVATSTKDLLLPFVKRKIRFRLQPELREELRNFVVTQDLPYLKYAIIGRIISINQLQNESEYEAVFEGMGFFEINEQKLIDCELDGRQCQVKVCCGFELSEQSTLTSHDFEYFFSIFDRVPHAYLMNSIYTQIDANIMSARNNPTAMVYSIYGILRLTDQQKYEVLASFNDQQRINQIDLYMNRFAVEDVVRNPSLAFKMQIPGNYSSTFMLIFILIMLFFYSYEFGFEEL